MCVCKPFPYTLPSATIINPLIPMLPTLIPCIKTSLCPHDPLSSTLTRETDDKTKRTQSDVGKRLGERIGDINFWKTELNHETDSMITETNQLNEVSHDLFVIINSSNFRGSLDSVLCDFTAAWHWRDLCCII